MSYLKKITLFAISLTLFNSPLWSMESLSINTKIEKIKKLEEIEIGKILSSSSHFTNLLLFTCCIKDRLNLDVKRYIANYLSCLLVEKLLDGNFEFFKTLSDRCSKTLSDRRRNFWTARSEAFSPHGKIVLTELKNNIVCLWNAKNGELIKQLSGQYLLAFSPNEKTVLTGSRNNIVCLWDTKRGELIKQLKGYSNCNLSVAFSPDSKILLTGSYDSGEKNSPACLWNTETGELVKQLEGHSDIVYSVAFSPDGKTLLTGSYDKTACLWSAETGELITQFKEDSGAVCSVGFSPDGKIVLTTQSDHDSDHDTVCFWSVDETGKLITQFEGNFCRISSVEFSPDGKAFLAKSSDYAACLWSTETGELIGSFNYLDCSIVFSPDGKTLFAGDSEYRPCLWNTATGELIKRLVEYNCSVYFVVFSPDGKTLLTKAQGNSIIYLWNGETGEPKGTLEGLPYAWSAVFSPDSKTLLVGLGDRVACLWNVETGECIRQLEGHSTEDVLAVAFSPDGKTIFTQSGSVISTKEGRIISAKSGSVISTAELNAATAYLWKRLPCEATAWILSKAHPLQAWLISKASQEKKIHGVFDIVKNSLEHEIFITMPEYVRDYLIKWYSIAIIS